jgi:hypothetical protein
VQIRGKRLPEVVQLELFTVRPRLTRVGLASNLAGAVATVQPGPFRGRLQITPEVPVGSAPRDRKEQRASRVTLDFGWAVERNTGATSGGNLRNSKTK